MDDAPSVHGQGVEFRITAALNHQNMKKKKTKKKINRCLLGAGKSAEGLPSLIYCALS